MASWKPLQTFHKTDWALCLCVTYSNLIPPRDGTNCLLRLVAYISQSGYQCFPACFSHTALGNFDVSPMLIYILEADMQLSVPGGGKFTHFPGGYG